jgi:hypothetical protein
MYGAKMPRLSYLSASFLPSTNLMSYPFDTCSPHETWRMQDFSSAYVRAISAVAGCSVTKPDVDNDSIDLILKRKREGTKIRSQQLDIQLKSTYTDCVRADHIAYSLKIKNYNELRPLNVAVARVLVIVTMNPEAGNWLDHTEDNLSLFKCGYYTSLRGMPQVANKSGVTIRIPRTQVFNASSLHGIFENLENGVMP